MSASTELCVKLDVWGEGYKIYVANFEGRQDPYLREESKKEEIVRVSFQEAPCHGVGNQRCRVKH